MYLGAALRPQPNLSKSTGYSLFLRLLLPFHSLTLVAVVQHLMGLAVAVMICALLRHHGVSKTWSAVATLPQLLDGYIIEDEHLIMTDLISNDPQGPVTRWGDERYQLVVRWVLNGMIAAEALGVTSKNVDEMKAKSTNAEVRRLLGVEGGFGAMMGISNDWMYNVIKQVGNYGESYERTVGMGSPLKLPRGKNELWTKGGLLFTSPFQ